MAIPKQATLIKVYPLSVMVWTDEPEKELAQIRKIRGIIKVMMLDDNQIFIKIDPRYDAGEIADEIETLLTAEIPDIFKNEILCHPRQP